MTAVSQLMRIQSFIQPYTLAIASILDAAVEVVDSNLIRVGGTDDYALRIGEQISHTAFFGEVLRTGTPGIIKDVKREMPCRQCERHERCPELANIAYPIFLGEEAVGVIGIIAFTEEERSRLTANRDKLFEFLKYMSILLGSKLSTQQHTQHLERQIDEIIITEKQQIKDRPLIGESRAIRDIISLVGKVSASDSTIMISGESGTGKEVLARLIHDQSPRNGKLMIIINCGAIPENLVESELFGYDEGAFTGAKKGGHAGKFELASESTLFLDEIGELPLHTQTKLLRVLQEKSVQPLGGKREITVDARIICATNRNLEDLVREGKFRQDLFYRLSVIPIEIPPLRQRKSDIPLLLNFFINHFNQHLRKKISGIDEAALNAFMAYEWPGNIRELRNVMEYLFNVIDVAIIKLSDLPRQMLAIRESPFPDGTLKSLMANHEKNLLAGMIEETATTEEKKRLADRLGISNSTLYRKLAGYGIR